ncbi:MAG: phosphotransferase [Defluviitaleaceae bacterium]|nr:phosphotransferase [Defluviitaleaceae bacterium]
MDDIKNYGSFVKIEPILKGMSDDRKYCVTTTNGTKYCLRIASAEKFANLNHQYKILKQVSQIGVPMCQPIDFGKCKDGVYTLYSWIEGEDLVTALPKLTEIEQYKLGLNAGQILRLIHSISKPDNQNNWEIEYNYKVDKNIKQYRDFEIKFDGGDNFVRYIEQNRYLLNGRPQSFKHGDYSVRNMMLCNDGLIILDFENYGYSDPWEEFKRTVFSAEISPHFTTGQINGYFNNNVPPEFFKLLAFYIATTYIPVLPWAVTINKQEVDYMLKVLSNITLWFDNMKNPIPTWYLGDFN